MESLKGILKVLKLPAKLKENLEIFNIIRHNWEQILEDKADCAYPFNFEEGVLYIAVEDPYELQNLNGRYLTILNRINHFLKIKNLSFSVKVLKFIYHPSKQNLARQKVKEEVFFEEESWSAMEKTLSQVVDEELKESLVKVLESYKQAHKRRRSMPPHAFRLG